MRVITGKYRGRVLKGPDHSGLRPTADRVKEALFNILGARIIDADLLDLFAGTGSIGIEALSRGANSVVFVDANRLSIKLLQENLKILSPDEKFRVCHGNAAQCIEMLAREQAVFDLIFLDPPFEEGLLPGTMAEIRRNRLLDEDGILIVEHPSKRAVSGSGFTGFLTRSYGDIGLSFFHQDS
jgi:16S rRNA (guanine966-N2)-methyltransferase